jgi:hypothetical protein
MQKIIKLFITAIIAVILTSCGGGGSSSSDSTPAGVSGSST